MQCIFDAQPIPIRHLTNIIRSYRQRWTQSKLTVNLALISRLSAWLIKAKLNYALVGTLENLRLQLVHCSIINPVLHLLLFAREFFNWQNFCTLARFVVSCHEKCLPRRRAFAPPCLLGQTLSRRQWTDRHLTITTLLLLLLAIWLTACDKWRALSSGD